MKKLNFDQLKGPMTGVGVKKLGIWTGFAIFVVAVIIGAGGLFETNNLGHYQVKQAFITGTPSVRNEPGVYSQLYGTITDYSVAGIVEFAKDGEGTGQPLKATFRGNSTADISGLLKYELSREFDVQMRLHELYGSDEAIGQTLVRQSIAEALKQTGPLFTPEEAFVSRRSEFTAIALGMLKEGIYKTYSEQVTIKDEDGGSRKEWVTKMLLDEAGKPVVEKPSTLKSFNIHLVDFVIRDFDFDTLTNNLIAAKKEAEQKKVVARAEAEKAKQDAITAEEQGKAAVAKAKAEELVKKIRSVTEAQKDFEVAEFRKKKAEQDAMAKLVEGEAEAKVAKLKVAAGLSPREKADIEMKTAIGVAEKLASVKLPDSLIVVGGDSKGGGKVDPFTAVGLESLHNLSRQVAQTGK